MSSKMALRMRKARQASRSSLALESLEPRLALAVLGGNVTAQLVGSTLLLTGDAFGNALIVASVPGGKMAVIGNGTTINGASTDVTPFVTSRAVTSIIANLGGGNDQIGFGNSPEGFANQLFSIGFAPAFIPSSLQGVIDPNITFSLPGSLSVTTAAGDDAVGLIGTVGGSVAMNLGSASTRNGFVVGDTSSIYALNRVGGGVAVVGGAQADVVLLYGTTVVGGVSAALGDGDSLFGVQAFGASFGSLAYTGGTGDDAVLLQEDLAVLSGVTIVTGPQGEDRVELRPGMTVGGSVVVNTGTGADRDDVRLRSAIRGGLSVTTGAGDDHLRFYTGSIVGGLTMNSGAGDDYVGVDTNSIGGGLVINSGEDDDYIEVFADTIGGGVAINSGAGDDFVECESTVGLNTVIDAGAGNDRVFSSGLTTRYNLFVYLGPGNDRLELYNSSAFAAFLYGGTGANTLTTNAATRSGIRTLKYFQFQTVNNL